MSLDAEALGQYARRIAMRIGDGRVIPFLGAGANLCDRPDDADWRSGAFLPSGSELACHLAKQYEYPGADPRDLVRVAQYVDLVTGGEGALFDELRPVFTGAYRPNRLHRFLAELPAQQRAGSSGENPLIVTTNYDDSVEHAFAEAQEPLDVVYYAFRSGEAGRFVHLTPAGDRVPIERHTEYLGLDLSRRSLLVKIHGDVDDADADDDNYVITEDHYIDYLAHSDLSKLIPAYIMRRMTNSHFLFLGHAMRDWNLRVILHHVWAQQARRFGSWAIERDPDPIDEQFWQRHRVQIVRASLEDWIDAMHAPHP